MIAALLLIVFGFAVYADRIGDQERCEARHESASREQVRRLCAPTEGDRGRPLRPH